MTRLAGAGPGTRSPRRFGRVEPLVVAALAWVLLPVQTSLLPPLLPAPLRPDLLLALALALAWEAEPRAAFASAALLGLARDTQSLAPFGASALATLAAAAAISAFRPWLVPAALPRLALGSLAGALYLAVLSLLGGPPRAVLPPGFLLPFALAQGAALLLLLPSFKACGAVR